MHVRWNPLDRDFDQLVRSVLFNDVGPASRVTQAREQTFAASADVVETETGYEVKVDLPGHDPKSIQVQLERDTLTLTSERKAAPRKETDTLLRVERPHGIFRRTFTLPKNVDANGIEASFEHGVLSVLIPKKEEEKARTIEVKVAG